MSIEMIKLSHIYITTLGNRGNDIGYNMLHCGLQVNHVCVVNKYKCMCC
jgi:hypothetical protein